jgi:hypothetical protein
VPALRAKDEVEVWKTYKIREQAKELDKGSGKVGPSGASVWGSPTLNAKRGCCTSPGATTSLRSQPA